MRNSKRVLGFLCWTQPRVSSVQKSFFMRGRKLASQSAAESLMIIVNDNFRISLFGTMQPTIYHVNNFFKKNEKGSKFYLTPLPANKNEGIMRSPYFVERNVPAYWQVLRQYSFLVSGNPMHLAMTRCAMIL